MPIDCTNAPNNGGGDCVHAQQTIETAYNYDLFGNQTSVTTYSDYGYRTFNSVWGQLQNIYPSSGQTTSIAYDSQYRLYPVSATNPLGQTTLFEIYGFNGVSVDGFQVQPGLLKKVTPPNNVPAIYEYDPFGRLGATYDSEASRGDIANRGDDDPVTRIRYWDNLWNSPSGVFLEPGANAPFMVAVHQRPGSYPQPTDSSSGFAYNDQTFYDGFGRPIQTRSIWRSVEGHHVSREIISSTAYNASGQVSCQTVPYDVDYYADRGGGSNWPYDVFISEPCTSTSIPHTATTYDALGRPLVVTAPDGTTSVKTYAVTNHVTVNGDSHLLRTQHFDANNHHTNTFTNARGELALVREFSGDSQATYASYADTRYTYDVLGNLTRVGTSNPTNSDPTTWLRETIMGYDDFGRKTSMNDPDMGAWNYRYDAAGNLLRQEANIITDDRRVLCFSYDILNRLTRKAGYLSNTTCPSSLPGSGSAHLSSQTYDRYQRLDTFDGSSLPTGWAGSGTYSVSGGQAHVTGNGINYGANIRRTGAIQDGQGMRFSFSANDANAIGTIYFDSGSFGQSNYRRWGLHIKDGVIHVLNYQGTSWETWSLLPFQANTWYEAELLLDDPNQFRVMVWQRDNPSIANGATRAQLNPNFIWHGLDWKMTSQVHTGTFYYDNYREFQAADVGQLAQTSWGSTPSQNNESFLYDNVGRLTSHTRLLDGRSFTMGYDGFDAFHRPTDITYPNDEIVILTYDREGENSLRAGSDWLVTDIRYNARGQMTFLDRHNVADTTYLYHPQNDASGGGLGDSNFRLKTIRHGASGSADLWPDFTYEYDQVGNITKMIVDSWPGTDTQSFGYDHLNRLTTAVATGGVANYTHNTANTDFEYDRLGNITYFGNTTLYNYATRHSSCGNQPVHAQPQAVKQIGGSYYCYDNNGNMTRRVEGGVSYQQNFNVENELTSVVVNGQTTSFTYDAAGIRVKTVKPDGSIIYTPFPHYEEELRLLPPTVSLAANGQSALSIPPNTSFTLAWSSSGAQSCAASGSWSGSKVINGSQNISGFASGSRTYTLTCQNAAGSTAATVTVSVTPLPTVNLTANGQSSLVLPPISSFTLAWSSSGTQSCTASGAPQWSGSKPTSGSQQMTAPLFGSQTYTLTCSNSSGSTSRSVTVTIGEAPPPCEGFFCTESLGNGATGLNAPEGGGPTQLIQRSAYQVAGQVIATRVISDPVSDNDGLFFIYSDHLGSASAITYGLDGAGDPHPQAGQLVGEVTRYYPFGGYRAAPTAQQSAISDRGYTGHKHNDDLGLIYMNARFFVVSIGRFASADTIVPDPTNPQQYNRYSYVLNNPLRYSDPTGHYCYDPSSGDLFGTCVDPDGTISYLPTLPQVTRLWIDPQSVTAIQLYGNTNFAYYLDGTGPSYDYSQGFHGGLDLLAEPGTEVVAGIHGTVKWISDWTAYKPRYIVIEIAPDAYIVIGHLSADNPSNLKAGQVVTPDTVVGTVEPTERHVHIEFWKGTGNNIANRTIEVPYQYMSPQVRRQFAALQQNMAQNDSRITFRRRADGLWSSMYEQPSLIYNGPNLNKD